MICKIWWSNYTHKIIILELIRPLILMRWEVLEIKIRGLSMHFKHNWYLYNYLLNHNTYDKDFEKIRVFNPKQCFENINFASKILRLTDDSSLDELHLEEEGTSATEWFSAHYRYGERFILKMNTCRLLINNLEFKIESQQIIREVEKNVHIRKVPDMPVKAIAIVPHTKPVAENSKRKLTFLHHETEITKQTHRSFALINKRDTYSAGQETSKREKSLKCLTEKKMWTRNEKEQWKMKKKYAR